jgi:hypothetical protein
MDVQVKLYGLFQQYAPEERREFELDKNNEFDTD